jgi:hypothetical protein
MAAPVPEIMDGSLYIRFAVIWVVFPVRMKPGKSHNKIILSPTINAIVWPRSLDDLMGESHLWLLGESI